MDVRVRGWRDEVVVRVIDWSSGRDIEGSFVCG